MIKTVSLDVVRCRFLLAVGFAICGAILITTIGQAHANLLRSDPADGSILEESPKEISMWFDEPISTRFSSAQLFDADSQRIEIPGLRTDPSDPTLLVLIMPELPDGVYSVLWKILSEVDGHYNQGLLVFGLGEGVELGSAALAPVEDPAPPMQEVLLRWVNLLMLVGFIGGVAMTPLVLSPAEANANNDIELLPIFQLATRRVLKLASMCAGGAFFVGIGLLLWQAVTLKDSLPEGFSFLSSVGQVLTQTRWGTLWLIRQVFLVCAGAGVISIFQAQKRAHTDQAPTRPKMVWLLAFGLSLVLIALQALSSHAAGLIADTALAVVSDGLHLIGASLWVGGLLSLGVGLLPLIRTHRGDIGDLVRAGWRPFSKVAALSVGLLLATGLYNTGRQVASLDALLTTLYGQALLGKIGLMLGVGLFGLLNASLLHPRLSAPLAKRLGRPPGWTPLPVRRLPLLVVAEGSLGLLVLLITGLVTASPAPRDPTFTIDPQDVPGALSQRVDDLVVTLNAKPNRPGQNVFTVFTASTRRPPPAEIARVILRFTYLDQDIGRESVTLEEVEPGRFLLGGNYLRLAGNWQIDVVVRRIGLEDSVAHFDWVVAPPGESRPVVVSKVPLESTLTLAAAAMFLLVPLAAYFVFWLGKRNSLKGSTSQEYTENLKLELSQ
jgi:copper transport protein